MNFNKQKTTTFSDYLNRRIEAGNWIFFSKSFTFPKNETIKKVLNLNSKNYYEKFYKVVFGSIPAHRLRF